MAAPDLIVKRFDTYPPLKATLTDSNGVIDLTSASTVKLIMKSQTVSPPALVTGYCTILSPPSAGQVVYDWASMDLSVADTYQAEFEIAWSGGGIQTVPNAEAENIYIEVDPDLEDA
jgi:hypothetical protein